MLTYRFCITVLLLLATAVASGETISIDGIGNASQLYWVVGSYGNRQTALRQSEKISWDVGMEVQVARATVAEEALYRLVILAWQDVERRQRQRQQLKSIGIDKPWMIRLDPTGAFIHAGYSDVEQTDLWYVILGSLKDSSEARLFADAVDVKIGLSSSIRVVEMDGQLYHRVLIGPYYREGDAQFTRQMVLDANIDDPWILTESNDNSSAGRAARWAEELLTRSSERLNEATTAAVILPPGRDLPQQEPSDYTFATLKRGSKPLFEAPGKAKKKYTRQNGPAISP